MRFWFNTREEAVDFLEKLDRLFEAFSRVTVAQIKKILNVDPDYTDYDKGWYDVSKFSIDTSYFVFGCLVAGPEPVEFGEESKDEPESDNVNHPNHYKTKNGLETIQVIEAFTDGLMGVEATDTGNVIKYICRWKKKNGLEDLKKAQWYLNHLINHVEKEN